MTVNVEIDVAEITQKLLDAATVRVRKPQVTITAELRPVKVGGSTKWRSFVRGLGSILNLAGRGNVRVKYKVVPPIDADLQDASELAKDFKAVEVALVGAMTTVKAHEASNLEQRIALQKARYTHAESLNAIREKMKEARRQLELAIAAGRDKQHAKP